MSIKIEKYLVSRIDNSLRIKLPIEMHDVFQSLFTDAFKHTDIQLFNGVTFILDNCYEERFVDFLNQAEEVLNHLEKVKTAKLSKAEMELLNEESKRIMNDK